MLAFNVGLVLQFHRIISLFIVLDNGLKIGNIETVARWEVNNKMDLQEVGWGGMNWIDLAQDRNKWLALLNVVMNLGLHKTWGIS
jgi:hypothetical protein